MLEIDKSGSMSGERKRDDGRFELPQVTAPLLDSTADEVCQEAAATSFDHSIDAREEVERWRY